MAAKSKATNAARRNPAITESNNECNNAKAAHRRRVPMLASQN
jgi:hypothetical protein